MVGKVLYLYYRYYTVGTRQSDDRKSHYRQYLVARASYSVHALGSYRDPRKEKMLPSNRDQLIPFYDITNFRI